MKNLANEEMSEFWNGEGGEKWVDFQDRVDESLATFGHKAMNRLKLVGGESVLDIGCGCGDTSIELARRVGLHGYVEGIDISDRILEQARKRKAIESLRNLNFKCSDVQFHRFEPMRFDVAFSRYGVMFFDDPVAAFRNIRYALKSGGRMSFICWRPILENQWVSFPLNIASNHVKIPEPPDRESPGAFSFGDKSRVERILSSAGFTDITVESYDAKFSVGENLEEAVNFLIHFGPASTAIKSQEIDNYTRMKFIMELYDSLSKYLIAEGVALGAATWIFTATNP